MVLGDQPRWPSQGGRVLAFPNCYCCATGCASGCVVECQTCCREVADLNLSLGYFAPRSTQPSIPPGSVNVYQLRLGRQRLYGAFRLRMNVWVCR